MVFRKRDRDDAADDGAAVLRYVDRFARGVLEPGARSETCVEPGVQHAYFVAGGSGVLLADGGERALRDGDGILVPPAVAHAFRNDGTAPLELLIVTVTVTSDAPSGNRSAIVRNFRDQPVGRAHWNHRPQRIFGGGEVLPPLYSVLVVGMDPMTTSDTHGHDESVDEVWYMWRGRGVHVVGREVCVQHPGTAIQVAPSDPGHSLINHTDEPLFAFYFHARK